jgi:tetratricopeptide (TPR) repeat protein
LASNAPPEIAALVGEAAKIADRLVERFPEDPDSVAVMAWLHFRFGKSEEAVRYWRRCLELNPGYGQAHFWIGSVARDRGDHQQAAESFRKARELDPGAPQLSVHLAQALMNQGKMDEAIEVLQESLRSQPKSMPTFLLLGQIYGQLKEYDKAKKNFEAAVEMYPGFTSAYYGLADACAKLGQTEKSKEHLEKFRDLKVRDEKAHRDALKANDGVSSVRHGVAEVCTLAGKVYLSHEDPQTAEDLLRRGADLCPTHPECLQVLAWLYERQGRTDEAMATWLRAKENHPENVSVHLRLGALYLRLGQFEGAEEAFTNVIQISPHQAGGYAALANLYLQANRKLPEAKRLALKAVEQEPLARHYFLLTTACQRNGDLADARSAIEQAVALDPGNPEYRRMRDVIGQDQSR